MRRRSLSTGQHVNDPLPSVFALPGGEGEDEPWLAHPSGTVWPRHIPGSRRRGWPKWRGCFSVRWSAGPECPEVLDLRVTMPMVLQPAGGCGLEIRDGLLERSVGRGTAVGLLPGRFLLAPVTPAECGRFPATLHFLRPGAVLEAVARATDRVLAAGLLAGTRSMPGRIFVFRMPGFAGDASDRETPWLFTALGFGSSGWGGNEELAFFAHRVAGLNTPLPELVRGLGAAKAARDESDARMERDDLVAWLPPGAPSGPG